MEPRAWTTAERLRLAFPPHGPPGNARLRLACQVGLGWSGPHCWHAPPGLLVCACALLLPSRCRWLRGVVERRPLRPSAPQVACQGGLRVVKRDGFWGQGKAVLPDLPPPAAGSSGSGGGASVAPLGPLEFVLDRRQRRP